MNNSFLKIIVLGFLIFFVGEVELRGQVRKYAKVKKVGRCVFNSRGTTEKYRKDKSVRVVFSDRNSNFSYKDAYFQKKHSEQELLTPFFILDEKNDTYELVIADNKLLGKPKGFLSVLLGTKYKFKDANSPEYVGWISKDKLLFYDHSLKDMENNNPIKYVVGVGNVEDLFSIHKLKIKDSIYLYKDPMLKNKSRFKLAANQVVYPYKKDKLGKTVLVSNFPAIAEDTISQVYGWLPVTMIHSIGQGFVYTTPKKIDVSSSFKNNDSLSLEFRDISSSYLYLPSTSENITWGEGSDLLVPIHVWDQTKNNLISLKGTDIPFSDINRMSRESQRTNIHLIIDDNEIHRLDTFISSFQNIWMLLSKYYTGENIRFSFASLGECDAMFLDRVSSFSDWLTFIQKASEEHLLEQRRIENVDIDDILQLMLKGQKGNFENNIFIIIGGEERLLPNKSGGYLHELLASKSSKFLFVKTHNEQANKSQNYILKIKNTLAEMESAYKDFIKGYMVDNSLFVKESAIVSIPSETDNVYIYDSPTNSLFNGGVVFPMIGKDVAAVSMEIALDSILQRTKQTDSSLIASLRNYEEEIGVLTGWSSKPIKDILSATEDSVRIAQIPRNSLKDDFFIRCSSKDPVLQNSQKGLLLSESEIEELIENYRSLLPFFAHRELTVKERRILKKKYKRQCKVVRKVFHKRVITPNDCISKLFYLKTGIPFYLDALGGLKIKNIHKAKLVDNNFSDCYFDLLQKVDQIEDNLLNNRFKKVDSKFFFVPLDILL